jgi:hypothetical protein
MRAFMSAAVDDENLTPCRPCHRDIDGRESHRLLRTGRIDAVGPAVGMAGAGGIDPPRHGVHESVGPAGGHDAGATRRLRTTSLIASVRLSPVLGAIASSTTDQSRWVSINWRPASVIEPDSDGYTEKLCAI